MEPSADPPKRSIADLVLGFVMILVLMAGSFMVGNTLGFGDGVNFTSQELQPQIDGLLDDWKRSLAGEARCNDDFIKVINDEVHFLGRR